MGYILPIDHNQYSQYQRRTIGNEKPSIFLERTFRTELKGMLHHRRYKLNDQLRKEEHGKQQERRQLKHELYTTDQTEVVKKDYAQLAKITGKGEHFSEMI
ncbi:hypothetical protein CEY16_00985 [Halalkalibacillus sediminis]|uniref:Uncharacterized protein n=1 Tax=Halalkalibacillus sediminis TaxID=2018042 RepID=A0A2I0QVM4_9BACI|nr:hypothetical protein [Halalkalibacillus sediminis]PKR78364.1 hypothetical protein CEY16_00985 [Halalkalibacillus sediminis]